MKLERFKILILPLVTSISFSILLSSCEPQVTADKGELTGRGTFNSDSTAATETSTTSDSQALIPNQNPLQSNRLELVSKGITYQLIEHWVYSNRTVPLLMVNGLINLPWKWIRL